MNDYDPQKPLQNYTHEELEALITKLVIRIFEAPHGILPPHEKQLLDMATLQRNKNLFNKFAAEMTYADFCRINGFAPPSSDDLFGP